MQAIQLEKTVNGADPTELKTTSFSLSSFKQRASDMVDNPIQTGNNEICSGFQLPSLGVFSHTADVTNSSLAVKV